MPMSAGILLFSLNAKKSWPTSPLCRLLLERLPEPNLTLLKDLVNLISHLSSDSRCVTCDLYYDLFMISPPIYVGKQSHIVSFSGKRFTSLASGCFEISWLALLLRVIHKISSDHESIVVTFCGPYQSQQISI